MSVSKEWEIPLRQTQKFCPDNLSVVALQTPIVKKHYMRHVGPFPRYVIFVIDKACAYKIIMQHRHA